MTQIHPLLAMLLLVTLAASCIESNPQPVPQDRETPGPGKRPPRAPGPEDKGLEGPTTMEREGGFDVSEETTAIEIAPEDALKDAIEPGDGLNDGIELEQGLNDSIEPRDGLNDDIWPEDSMDHASKPKAEVIDEFESEQCTPNCEGKECGDDGCGGTCGECPPGVDCVGYKCVVNCIPEGGIFFPGGTETCCEGLVAVPECEVIGEGDNPCTPSCLCKESLVCIACGDGICGDGENVCTCAEDCLVCPLGDSG